MGYGILDTEYGIWGCGTWDSGLLDIVKISKPGKNEAGNANGGTRSERVHYTSTTRGFGIIGLGSGVLGIQHVDHSRRLLYSWEKVVLLRVKNIFYIIFSCIYYK